MKKTRCGEITKLIIVGVLCDRLGLVNEWNEKFWYGNNEGNMSRNKNEIMMSRNKEENYMLWKIIDIALITNQILDN